MQLLIVGTFLGVLALMLGLYWALVLRVEDRSTAAIRKRLKRGVSVAAKGPVAIAKEEPQLSSVDGLNRLLQRTTSLSGPLERLIEQADARLTVGMFLMMTALALTAGYAVIFFLTGLRGIAAVVGILLSAGPYCYLRWKRSKRLIEFEEKFPEAIDLIARALRAGHAFSTGIGMVAEEIPDPIGSEFKLLYDRQNFGMPLADALRSFAERVPILDARFFATAVLTQREAGGNLSEVLDNLAKVVRERFKVKRQIRVVSAHARMTGWFLVGIPPVTAMGMLAINTDHAKLLVTDPIGIKLVITAVVMQVIGAMIVKKLVNVEY